MRYNLGGADKILRVSSVTVADAKPRSVIVLRSQNSLEIVVNGTHLARTASSSSSSSSLPAGSTNTTLSVQPGHLFLGGEVDVATGNLISGFKGCLHGVKLDMVELPLSEGGSDSFRILKFPPGGAIPGCPLLSVKEREQPDLHVYVGMGAIIGGLLLVSFVFIITCAIAGFLWRKRRGDFDPNRSRPVSPRNSGFTWRGPDELNDQKFRSSDNLELRPTNYQPNHSRSPSNESEIEDVTGNFSHSNSTFQKPMQFTSVSIEPAHSRQESRQSEGSIKNFAYLHSTPPGSDHEDGARRPSSARSSSGHFSVRSDDSLHGIGSEHQRKVMEMRKRVEKADMALEDAIIVDEMTHFSSEGPFEPLGSIGSLHDIILVDGQVQQRPAKHNMPTPGLAYKPSAAQSYTQHYHQLPPMNSVQPTGQQPAERTAPQRIANGSTSHQPGSRKMAAAQPHHPEVKKGSSKRKPTSPTKTNPLTPTGQRLKMERKHKERANPLYHDVKAQGHLQNQHQLQQGSKAPPPQFRPPQPPKVEKTSLVDKPQGKKWEVSIYEKGARELGNQDQSEGGHSKQSQKLRKSARRSGRLVRKGSAENILDKFNIITMAGGFSQDSKDTTEVL